MSGKYEYKPSSTMVDLATVLEPTIGTEASWCSQFTGESFNTASASTANSLTISQYEVNGTSIRGVKKGYLPTKQFKFAEFTTSGDYYFTRTDAGITFTDSAGSTLSTIKASQFRGSQTPWQILVVIAAGGGGGGGNGYYKAAKDDYRVRHGGAGGGGAVQVCKLTLVNGKQYRVTVGSGGSCGSHGSSSEESSGAAGGNGGWSNLVCTTDSTTYGGVYGGRGGAGGTSASNGYGAGGDGGTVYSGSNGVSGGKGNYFNSHTNTGISALTYTPTTDTGVGSLTFCTAKNNNSATENKSVTDGTSYFSGGCSYGLGAYFASSSTPASYGGAGGGSCAGSWITAGRAGCAIFYY